MASRKARPRPDVVLPEKAYFRIGEVARIAGVAPSVLRFWETEFKALKPEKTRTNQRVYARRHVELALEIKALLYDRGFTIAGAQKELQGGRARSGLSDELVARLKKELRELLQLLDE